MQKIEAFKYNKKFMIELYESIVLKQVEIKYFTRKSLMICVFLIISFHSLFLYFHEEVRMFFIPYIVFIVFLFSFIHKVVLTKQKVKIFDTNRIAVLEKIERIDNDVIRKYFKQNYEKDDYGLNGFEKHLDNLILNNFIQK